MSKIEITKTQLVWPGKYNEDGTLEEVPRVNLPFQIIETIFWKKWGQILILDFTIGVSSIKKLAVRDDRMQIAECRFNKETA